MVNRLPCPTTVVAIAMILGSGGCTSQTAPQTYPTVVEVVFPNGRPFPGAQVTLRSVNDHKITARGKADNDGLCRLTTYEQGDGAVIGEHQVAVAAPFDGIDLDQAQMVEISPKYANYSTSGLLFTVSEDETANRFKIVVTKN
jgi:hypothetical protein